MIFCLLKELCHLLLEIFELIKSRWILIVLNDFMVLSAENKILLKGITIILFLYDFVIEAVVWIYSHRTSTVIKRF